MPNYDEQNELQILKEKSPYSLPTDTSQSGWSAEQIKEKFYEGLFYLYSLFQNLRTDTSNHLATSDTNMENFKTEINQTIQSLSDELSMIDLSLYAKTADISNGTIAVLKYIKANGANAKISDLDTLIASNYNELKSYFDANGKALNSVLSDKATNDAQGRNIVDTYALKEDFNPVKSNVTSILNGSTYVPKSMSDKDGNPIHTSYVKANQKGVANGVATLNENGVIPTSQLPSYVDDVLEFDNKNSFPSTGESGKIYIAKNTNTSYRWSGTQYSVIGTDLALGETSSTAYAGNKGKENREDIDQLLIDIDTRLSFIKDVTEYETTKALILSAYNNTSFTSKVILLGKSAEDGEVRVTCDESKTHYVITDLDGYIQYARIKSPFTIDDVTIGDRYLEADDEIIKGITDARIGITSQYVSQPSNVKVGSSIYIDAKLRDSVNLFNVNVSGNWGISGDRFATFNKLESGVQFTLTSEKPAQSSSWLYTPTLALEDLELKVGDTLVLSANTSVSNPDLNAVIMIHFYDESKQSIGNVAKISPKGGGYISTNPTTIPSGTIFIRLILSTNYSNTVPANTTYTFTNVQLQKGNEATAYEPYGAYSKGKVMQYASKNILNLPGTKQTANTTSLIGKANVSYTIPNATTSQLLPQNDGSFGTTSTNAKRINVKKNHKYFVSLIGEFQGQIPDAFGIYDSDFVFMNSTLVQSMDRRIYCGIITSSQDANDGFVTNMYWNGTNRYFTQGDVVVGMVVIDLTANGDHNLTVEEAYGKYSSSFGTLASGESIVNNVYQSPLIKAYGKDLYLTKVIYYKLVLYEFKENPPALNEDVSLDDLTLIKATTYSSSSQIELDAQTNSIMYFVYAPNYRSISQEELAAWQNSSQLEYGQAPTEHSDYTAPIEIGTFDKAVDGDEKTFSFVVLGTENQNIGFMPQENFISIDFAEDVSDFTKSTFAYISTNLANQVAELDSRTSNLETEIFDVNENLVAIDEAITKEVITETGTSLSIANISNKIINWTPNASSSNASASIMNAKDCVINIDTSNATHFNDNAVYSGVSLTINIRGQNFSISPIGLPPRSEIKSFKFTVPSIWFGGTENATITTPLVAYDSLFSSAESTPTNYIAFLVTHPSSRGLLNNTKMVKFNYRLTFIGYMLCVEFIPYIVDFDDGSNE